MKNARVLMLTLFALLSILSVSAEAAAPPAPVTPAATAPADDLSVDLACDLGLTAASVLPGSTQDPSPAVEVCGTCGQDLCDNRNVGALCYNTLEPGWGWCIPPWGGSCTDGRPNCQCVTEYQ
jgi:hypothetical protein